MIATQLSSTRLWRGLIAFLLVVDLLLLLSACTSLSQSTTRERTVQHTTGTVAGAQVNLVTEGQSEAQTNSQSSTPILPTIQAVADTASNIPGPVGIVAGIASAVLGAGGAYLATRTKVNAVPQLIDGIDAFKDQIRATLPKDQAETLVATLHTALDGAQDNSTKAIVAKETSN